MRSLLLTLCLSFLLVACGAEPALDLNQLEGNARGGDARAIGQLVELLGDPSEELADRAYRVLVEIGAPAVPALLARAEAADRQQREYVIAALGTLKVNEAVPALGRVLADGSKERRYVAAWALGEIGTPEVLPPLLAALDDANSEVRRYATRALIKQHKRAVPVLLDFLADASGEGAAGAIRVLGDIADPRALEVLLARVDGEQRGEAFLALGKLRDARAESALVKGLADFDPQVRMNAAMALGPLGGPEAEAPLRQLLEDETHVVREWAARSLEMITGQPVLYRNSHDEYVRPYNVYH